jgi:hypothetical protein
MPIFYFHDLMDFKDPTYEQPLRTFGARGVPWTTRVPSK